MQSYKIPKQYEVYLNMINQIFEIEEKTEKLTEHNTINRNIIRLKEMFESDLPFQNETSVVYHNPLGEPYDETRIDCEASIAGESSDNLIVTEAIRPIIRIKQNGIQTIVQKAIVIVESSNK